ncbi:TRAM domain-containing protein [Halopiger aswanensis]|uniref:Putative RNA-binding protein with TRAM domain n=1 Tax=Halopiger aswanensis TaxID=148449 RepID=A0A419WJZ0_9EURY|nr:RNA-binding protein [Halopiger aswanensis]RKD95779.1 putative RNA-binding protein with TRAM domain [Halopiger aswanensis]
MLGLVAAVLVLVVALVVATWLLPRVVGGLRSTDRLKSWRRHREAQEREPPVDIGDVEAVAVHEFTEHHSGDRHAVCKIEGFVVFVEDVPSSVAAGDVIEIKILSFNRGHTSATARFLETA